MPPISTIAMPALAEKTEKPHSCGGLKTSTSKRASIASAIRRKGSFLLNLSIRLKKHRNDGNFHPRHTETEKDGSWYHTMDRYITPYGSEGTSRSSSHRRKRLFWTISGTRSKGSLEETIWEPDELGPSPTPDTPVSDQPLSKTKSITRSLVQSLRRRSIGQRMPIQVEKGEPGNQEPTNDTKQSLPVLAVSPTDDSSGADRRSSFWLGVQKAVQDNVDENFCLHEHCETPVATTRVTTTEIYFPKRSRGKKTSSRITKTFEPTHASALVWPGEHKDVYELEAREVCTERSSEIAARSYKPDQTTLRHYRGLIVHISQHLKPSTRPPVCTMRARCRDKFLESSREVFQNAGGDCEAHRLKKSMQLLQSPKLAATIPLRARRRRAKLRKHTLESLAMKSVLPIDFPPDADKKQTERRAALDLPRDNQDLGNGKAMPAVCAARLDTPKLPGSLDYADESLSPVGSNGVPSIVLKEMDCFGLEDTHITPSTNSITRFRTPDISEESAVTVDDEHSAGRRNTWSPDGVGEERDTPTDGKARGVSPTPEVSPLCVDGRSYENHPDTHPAHSDIVDDHDCYTRTPVRNRALHSSVDEFIYGGREPL
ncbi:hypothetical protein B0T19DRAFT_123907 [Cercophora scortea]|uniref:Uncharacterized protein n=1 Tax=Cercophora scortea TaxID=314031 RepID=A0AAE0MI07_9PEZI|nr:hypothetical protein B0T19DRAFT_123907 [Cercophora scortea]